MECVSPARLKLPPGVPPAPSWKLDFRESLRSKVVTTASRVIAASGARSNDRSVRERLIPRPERTPASVARLGSASPLHEITPAGPTGGAMPQAKASREVALAHRADAIA